MTRLNVLVLYDAPSVVTRFVSEHLEAFARHSRYAVAYMPATGTVCGAAAAASLAGFDAVVIHFSVRLPYDVLNRDLAAALARFGGAKIAMPQDEYDLPLVVARRFLDLGVEAVFTTVPEVDRKHFYPPELAAGIEFHPCLTGYVGEATEIERFGLPLAERPYRFVYRGRRLPVWYGALADEKVGIGLRMKEACAARGLPCDIAVEEGARILGDDWYRFLGSGRATLASESGSNVVDATGLIRERCASLQRDDPSLSRAAIYDAVVRPHDGLVHMNQLPPKIFEAARLRTALVLYEGKWSGILEPGRHYIPLRKDWSNIEDVLAAVGDDATVGAMTERAYADLVASGRWSYARFIERVDDVVERLALRRRAAAVDGVVTPRLAPGPPRFAGDRWDGWPTAQPYPPPPSRLPILSGRARMLWRALPKGLRGSITDRFGGHADRIVARIRSWRS